MDIITKKIVKHNGLELDNVFQVSLPKQTRFSYIVATFCRILDKVGFHRFVSIANYSTVKNQKGILREYYKTNIETYAMVFIGREKKRILQ